MYITLNCSGQIEMKHQRTCIPAQ